jgi:deazaflavin-dependent oxidoreductase (nitroreductase family)
MDQGEEFGYLRTTGRRSGQPHVIEIWFGEHAGTIYLLSGGGDRADWVRNLKVDPRVTIRLGGSRRLTPDGGTEATASLVTDPAEDTLARQLLAGKYQGWAPGRELSDWARTALVVAVHPV